MKLRPLSPAVNLRTKIEEAPLPPKTEMAKNVTKSIVSNLKGIISGEGVVLDKEEVHKRMGICNQCEFFRYSDQRCGKCGCILAYKTYLKAEKCPIGRW